MPSSKDSIDCCLNSLVDIVISLEFKRCIDKCYLLQTAMITLFKVKPDIIMLYTKDSIDCCPNSQVNSTVISL